MHLGIGHRSYKHHKVSAALMLIMLTLFEVAALLPLSANLFAVLGEPPRMCTCMRLQPPGFLRLHGLERMLSVVAPHTMCHERENLLRVCCGHAAALVAGALCVCLMAPKEQPRFPWLAIGLQVWLLKCVYQRFRTLIGLPCMGLGPRAAYRIGLPATHTHTCRSQLAVGRSRNAV